MKNRNPKDAENREKSDGSKLAYHKRNSMKSKNTRRLGGQGLSLEAFGGAKSTNSYFNPAIISMKPSP